MKIFKPLENPDSYHWIKILHVGSLIAVWWPWGKDETSDDMAYPFVGLRLWKKYYYTLSSYHRLHHLF